MSTRYQLRDLNRQALPYDWPSWLYCRLGALILWVLQPLRLSPNAISWLGPLSGGLAFLVLFLFSAEAALAKFGFVILASLAYMADEMDGIWARTTGKTSRYGGWLDWKCGEAKDWLLNLALIVHWGRYLLLEWDQAHPVFFTYYIEELFPLFALLVLVFFTGKGIYLSVRWIPERRDRDYLQTDYRLPPLCLVGDAFKVGVLYTGAVFAFPVFAGWLVLYTGMYWLGIFVQLRRQKRVQSDQKEAP